VLNKYEDKDLSLHLTVEGDTIELLAEPFVEEITKAEILDLYKHVLTQKPKQFSVGMYKKVSCLSCSLDFIIYKKQLFCPCCFNLDIIDDEADVNFEFPALFEEWQKRKLYIERIINGDVIEFLDNYNSNIEPQKEEHDYFGDEVTVDE
jgi:hypothetical protein